MTTAYARKANVTIAPAALIATITQTSGLVSWRLLSLDAIHPAALNPGAQATVDGDVSRRSMVDGGGPAFLWPAFVPQWAWHPPSGNRDAGGVRTEWL